MTYNDKPYDEMTSAERAEAFAHWKAEENERCLAIIRENAAAAERLAASFDNDIIALVTAANACPISMAGNAEARRYYHAAEIAQRLVRSQR